MIICPACKEEIEDDSLYCDQCGQQLLFCKQCGHVGLGRRCTRCGGVMVLRQGGAYESRQGSSVNASPISNAVAESGMPKVSSASRASNVSANISVGPAISISQAGAARTGIPTMMLANDNLNIRIAAMNGAIIGRRKGPYVQFFEQHSYVSGVHAQLKYKAGSGWCVIDKNSSNGTRVNQKAIQPDVETLLKNGDILTIANINLKVIIR